MVRLQITVTILLAVALSGQPRAAALAGDAASTGKVLVLAAASTTDAIEDVCREFARLHPGVSVRASYAASSTLARQIEAGAEADLFLSASVEWSEYLAKRKLVARQQELLANELVLIVPADSRLAITKPADLTSPQVRRIALADVASVPAGVYAKQALEKLDLWKQLSDKVTGAADVRQALQFVESGAAAAGIVYATDAAASKRVRVVARFEAGLSEPIRYPLVLLKHGSHNPAAVALFEFLTSQPAAAVFRRHGFVVLQPDVQRKPTE